MFGFFVVCLDWGGREVWFCYVLLFVFYSYLGSFGLFFTAESSVSFCVLKCVAC